MQIDGHITADEYSNFDNKVCTLFPLINSDEIDWRRVSVATWIQEYGAADDIAIEVKSDDGNDEDNENESDVSQIISREAVNLVDRLFHADGMNVDDTNVLLTIRENMENLIIQQKKQTFIGN